MPDHTARLYHELAEWFHLVTAPSEYAEAAEFYLQTLREASEEPPATLLELGSGGGNNAFHLKRHLRCTLVDMAPGMLAASAGPNPECEHLEGDMRTLRLGRSFDCVFIQDAVGHLTSEADLYSAIETAFVHCRPGGAALFAPDHVRETFAPTTEHGGHDGERRGVRYLAWSTDPDPTDSTYVDDHVYLIREEGRPLRVEHDTFVMGLFGRAHWLRLLTRAGFRAQTKRYPANVPAGGGREIFVATKPRA